MSIYEVHSTAPFLQTKSSQRCSSHRKYFPGVKLHLIHTEYGCMFCTGVSFGFQGRSLQLKGAPAQLPCYFTVPNFSNFNRHSVPSIWDIEMDMSLSDMIIPFLLIRPVLSPTLCILPQLGPLWCSFRMEVLNRLSAACFPPQTSGPMLILFPILWSVGKNIWTSMKGLSRGRHCHSCLPVFRRLYFLSSVVTLSVPWCRILLGSSGLYLENNSPFFF